MAEPDQFRMLGRRRTGRRIGKIALARLRRLAGLLVTVLALIVAVAVFIKDGRRLLTHSFHLDPLLVMLSFAVECTGLPLAVLVWRRILARFGNHLSYRDDFRIYCYSMLGVAIPGGFWPLVSRSVLYERRGVSGICVAAASMVESVLVGLAGLMVYSLVATLIPFESIWLRPSVALAIAALAFVLVQPPVFNRVIGWLLSRLYPNSGPAVSLRYADLGGWLVLEAILVVIGGSAVYLLLRGLTTVPAGLFVPVVSAWAAAVIAGNLLFWIPATSIIRDGAMTLILMQLLPASVVILFVLLVRVWTIASVVIVAVLAWLLLRRDVRDPV